MKRMKMLIASLAIVGSVASVTVVSQHAYAQEAAPVVEMAAPAAAVAQDTAPAGDEKSIEQIAQEVTRGIELWRLMGWQAGLAMLLTAFLSTLKNSMLRQLIWAKCPEWLKGFLAPIISVVIYVLATPGVTALGFALALTTGILAVYLHQSLDALKKAPFIGPKMVAVIDMIGGLLGKKPTEKDLVEAEARNLVAAKKAA